MQTAEELMSLAWRCQSAGDVRQAEQLYRKAVEVDRAHGPAVSALGTACLRLGKLEEAVANLQRASELTPDRVEVHSNLGVAMARVGRLADAVACFERALRLDPGMIDARNNLGNALRELGRLDEAAACFRELLVRQGPNAATLSNLGLVLLAQGRGAEAVAHLRQATSIAPNDAGVLVDLGRTLIDCGDPAEAIGLLERACRLRPDLCDAHFHLGAALIRAENPKAAIASLEQAIALNPTLADAHCALGAALAKSQDFEAGVLHFQEALRLRPQYPEALISLGNALRNCGNFAEAFERVRQGLALKPDFAEGHLNLAIILSELKQNGEASEEFSAALRLAPDDANIHRHLALMLLERGEWEKGWQEFEWRWKCPEFGSRTFRQPRWSGESLAGKTILLHAEQGLGDTLHFIRYAALVKKKGATVLVECPAVLHSILARCQGIDRLIVAGSKLPEFDVEAPLMSLPGILGTRVSDIPADIPYLFADSERVSEWQRELRLLRGLRVGVAWHGNPNLARNPWRSFPLRELAPLARVPGVSLVSLQKGQGAEQLAAVRDLMEITDFGGRLDRTGGAFLDTAAIMKNLDLVITCDTAIGHLAGALGVPVWLALGYTADWRWLTDRDETAWYPTMRLFRQSQPGAWSTVFGKMAIELEALRPTVPRSRPILVEVAPGELVDKITILEIKSERLSDPQKLKNVKIELDTLRDACREVLPASEALARLTADLKAVNELLWDVEDDIRDCERAGDFGPRFIELARSVYRHNDRRAALKRSINELTGSRLIEEKSYASYTNDAIPR